MALPGSRKSIVINGFFSFLLNVKLYLYVFDVEFCLIRQAFLMVIKVGTERCIFFLISSVARIFDKDS